MLWLLACLLTRYCCMLPAAAAALKGLLPQLCQLVVVAAAASGCEALCTLTVKTAAVCCCRTAAQLPAAQLPNAAGCCYIHSALHTLTVENAGMPATSRQILLLCHCCRSCPVAAHPSKQSTAHLDCGEGCCMRLQRLALLLLNGEQLHQAARKLRPAGKQQNEAAAPKMTRTLNKQHEPA